MLPPLVSIEPLTSDSKFNTLLFSTNLAFVCKTETLGSFMVMLYWF